MITSELLAKIFPATRKSLRDRFIPAFNKYLPLYGITTKARIAAFLATGGIETDYLRTTTEYASGADYEGRKDLGNTEAGDGRKFRGHGFFQTTGRANHRRVTEVTFSKLGIDFEKHPEKLAEIETAIESACIYWKDNNLSKYADKGDFFGVSGVVNRGSAKKQALHWSKRKALYEICLVKIPKSFSFTASEPVAPEASPIAAPPPLPSPSEASTNPPADNSDFLANAFDKNVSADDLKTVAKENAPTLWKTLVRPLAWLLAALEAGNVYAWLGVSVAVVFIAVELYLHRAKIFKLWAKFKAKFIS